MSENRQDLPSRLAKARQHLEQARLRVTELESQLFEEQPDLRTSITNEDRYHRTLDNMLEGCQIIGYDWRYLYINDTVARHGQRAKEELLGRTMMECYPGIEKTEMFAVLQRCMQERTIEYMENEFTYPDGSTGWFELRVQPVPEGIFILSLDITVHKQAEVAIHRYAQRMELLHEIDRGIIEGRTTQEILSATLKHIRDLVPCQHVGVLVFDEENNQARVLAAEIVGPFEAHIGIRRAIPSADWIASFGADRIKIIDDLRELPELIALHELPYKEGMRSILHVLLTLEGQPIGLFNLLADTPQFFTNDHQEIAAEVASQFAVAIHQMRLSEVVTQQSAQLEQTVVERTAELQAAKERVEAILNSSPDGILLAHKDFTIQQTNAAFDKLFVCEADAYFGQPLTALLHTEDGTLLSQVIQADDAEEQQVTNVEARARRHDGSEFDAELSVGFIKDDGLVCTIRDITERKAQQRQLHLYAGMQENLSDAVITSDLEFRIQSWNKAAECMYGWRAEEAIGKQVDELFETRFATEEVGQSFRQEFFTEGFWNGEVVQYHKGGNAINVLGSVTLLRDEKGAAFGIVAVSHDITQQKAQEHQLRYYASLQESVADAVISTDMAFRIQSWNPAAEKIYGWRADEVLGKTMQEVLQTQYESEEEKARILKAFLQQGYWHGECVQHRKDGGQIHILESTTLFKDEYGESLGIVTVNHDITARRQADLERREAERRYHALFEQSHDAVFIVDMQGNHLEANRRAAALLGYTVEEIQTSSIREVSAEVPQSEAVLERLIAGEDIPMYEHDFRRKDGSLIPVEVSTEIVRDDEGKPLHIQSIARDISERKQAESAMQAKLEEEQEFQRYLQALHEITIELTPIHDLDAFYRRAVELGLERLGLERLALFLHDEERGLAIGTYGTDEHGNLVDEHHMQFPPTKEHIMVQAFHHVERFAYRESAQLYTALEPIGIGWNAAAVLWNGTSSLGWLAADNGVNHKPATKPILETLALYAMQLGALLAQKKSNAALWENEERFRQIIENIDQILYMRSGDDQKMLYISPAYETIWGKSATSLYANPDSYLEAIHPEDALPVRQQFMSQRYLEKGLADFEYRIFRSDGVIRWVRARTFPIRNADGAIVRRAGIIEDITESKRAEQALKESETRFRNAIIDAPFPIMIHAEDGEVLTISKVWTEITGYTREDIPTITDWTQRAYGVRQREVQTVISATYNRSEPFKAGEDRVRTKSGDVRNWDFVAAPLDPLPDGRRVLFAMAMDVTERKRAEDALRESEEKFRKLLDAAPIATIISDETGRITLVNVQAEILFGYDRTELVGQGVEILVPDHAREQHVRHRANYIAAPRIRQMGQGLELFAKRKDGSEFPVEIQLSFVVSQDSLRVMSFVIDITERKRAEAALRQALAKEKDLNELKSRFVSMASHEFRTPLATILALTDTLHAYRHKLPDNQIDKRFEKIKDQIGHLKDIMEDVLLLARMQARRVDFNPVRANLDDLCLSVLDEFRSLPTVTNRIEYTCHTTLREVMLDKKLMRQIINNLVSNAIKYSPEASSIKVSLDREGEDLILSVSDSGIGIPEADLDYLFEPFHRAANVGAISGTGLGLVIIKESVELHGGTIIVESEVDVGTTFTINIPISTTGGSDNDDNSDH